MKIYNKITSYIVDNYSNREISSSDMSSFKTIFNKENNLALFKEIVANDDLLETISKRSYSHALGFDKIVLFDMSQDTEESNKVQLRFHLWNPKSQGVPMTESMHEHSFNFISYILNGQLENQIFCMKDINAEENKELNKFLNVLDKMDKEDKLFLNNQIELLEINNLKELGSDQFLSSALKDLDLPKVNKLLQGSIKNIANLTKYQGHYVSNRIRGEKKSYKHVFERNVSLAPDSVLKVKEGDYYFHPFQNPHRLHYDNHELNATLLVTTPILSNPQGGSLQRPSYVEGCEQNYDKKTITKDELKLKILNLINVLESQII